MFNYNKQAPIIKFDLLILIQLSLTESKNIKIFFSIYAFFNLINAAFYFLIYANDLCFFINYIKDLAYSKYPLIKFRLKLINLKKD